MYYIDTPTRHVDAFDFDPVEGGISNRRHVIEIPKDMGYPDGMTIDAEGKLWVALWAGWGVGRWDPSTGELLAKVQLPVECVRFSPISIREGLVFCSVMEGCFYQQERAAWSCFFEHRRWQACESDIYSK